MADADDFTKISNKCARGLALIEAKKQLKAVVGDVFEKNIPQSWKDEMDADKQAMKQDIVNVVATWGMTPVP